MWFVIFMHAIVFWHFWEPKICHSHALQVGSKKICSSNYHQLNTARHVQCSSICSAVCIGIVYLVFKPFAFGYFLRILIRPNALEGLRKEVQILPIPFTRLSVRLLPHLASWNSGPSNKVIKVCLSRRRFITLGIVYDKEGWDWTSALAQMQTRPNPINLFSIKLE